MEHEDRLYIVRHRADGAAEVEKDNVMTVAEEYKRGFDAGYAYAISENKAHDAEKEKLLDAVHQLFRTIDLEALEALEALEDSETWEDSEALEALKTEAYNDGVADVLELLKKNGIVKQPEWSLSSGRTDEA